MAEAIEAVAAQVGQLRSTVQAQLGTIQRQSARVNQLESEASSSRLLLERSQSANERLVEAFEKLGQKGSTVDSKGVGKPFTFSSDEARFAAWQKKLRNYVAAALPGARVFMD